MYAARALAQLLRVSTWHAWEEKLQMKNSGGVKAPNG